MITIAIITAPGFNMATTTNFIDAFRACNYLAGQQLFSWSISHIGDDAPVADAPAAGSATVTIGATTYVADQQVVCVQIGGALGGSWNDATGDIAISIDLPPADWEDNPDDWSPPSVRIDDDSDPAGPLQFQAVTLDHDAYVGRLVIGRVERGTLERGAMATHASTRTSGPYTVNGWLRRISSGRDPGVGTPR